MRAMVRTVVVSGIVGAIGLAASAFGQVGTPPPGAGWLTARPPREARPEDRGRLEARKAAPARPEACGKSGAPRHDLPGRLVHSEAKVTERDGGFALLIADRGTVTGVDASARRVTIERADGERVTVQAGDQTRICRNGQPATLDQVQAGDHAGILQVERDGNRTVRAIRAFSPDFVQSQEDRRKSPDRPRPPKPSPNPGAPRGG